MTTYNRKVSEYGGYGVNITLDHDRNTPQVFWTKRDNSYVIVADPKGHYQTPDLVTVALLSINGLGEIRWRVEGKLSDWYGGSEDLAAYNYFQLTYRENREAR